MTLAEIDRLNILYFGDMQLPAKEKALRVRMAAEFEVLVRKYLTALQNIYNSDLSEQEKQAAVTMTAAAFSREYRRFFNQWYYRYYEAAEGTDPSGEEAQWRNNHSTQLSVWLANTARNTPSGSVMSHLRTDIRTEINAMCNLAVFLALAESGATEKKWHSHHDELTRPTHAAADGQIVPIHAPFIVGGYRLLFPGDTSLGAPPQEIANCRCVVERVRSD